MRTARRRPAAAASMAGLLIAVTLAACSANSGVHAAASHASTVRAPASASPAATTPAAVAGSSVAPQSASSAPPPPATVHADELGQVPVLMIHEVVAHGTGDYWQTPAELRAQFESLAHAGYVPITAAELVAGKIDIPAGKSPVVLTFDDGSPGQFRLAADGAPAPDCAVGVLLDVARANPGFTPVGTFYVNDHPFGQADPGPYLHWLVAHGFEIGNHTLTHPNLHTLATTDVERELVQLQQLITTALPGYDVRTMALPFGVYPADESLDQDGAWHGVRYHYSGVMLVGANPAASPFSAQWNPARIPRLRSAHNHVDFDAAYWLPKITTTRYVSDGDPSRISFPRAEASRLAPSLQARAYPY